MNFNKFRVWDNVQSRLVYFDTTTIDFHTNKKPFIKFKNDNLLKSVSIGGYSDEMPCIGLKDVLGKEYYAGDVFKFVNSDGFENFYRLYYCQDEARFKARSLNVDGIDCGVNQVWLAKKEIVGNVYEHNWNFEECGTNG